VKVFLKIHSEDYFNFVISKGRDSVEWLDGDTYISPGTHRALERLAGIPEIVERKISSWNIILILPRPPGHHAGKKVEALRLQH